MKYEERHDLCVRIDRGINILEGHSTSHYLQAIVQDIARSRHGKDEQEEDEKTSLPVVASDPLRGKEDCPHELTCAKQTERMSHGSSYMTADTDLKRVGQSFLDPWSQASMRPNS